MKKKIFTLLTLLVWCVTGAWAERTLIAKITVTSQTEFTTDGSLIGSGATNGLGKDSDLGKISGNGSYVAITLSSGNYFKPGDEIEIVGTKAMQIFEGALGSNNSGSATPLLVTGSVSDGKTTGTIPNTLSPNTSSISIGRTSSTYNGKVTSFAVYREISSETFTVSFNAGDHGTYTGGDKTEASAGAGITLPDLTTLNDGYIFNGWYTAASGGIKVGNAGNTYYPTASGTVYAQYSAIAAPEITTQPENTSAAGGNSVTFSVVATGTPTPTYQWYTCDSEGDNEDDIDGATSASYNFLAPAYNAGGTNVYYFKVKVTNSVKTISSNVVSLTVNKKFVCSAYLSSAADAPIQGNCTLKYYSSEGSEGTIPAGAQDGSYFYAKMNDNANYYELTTGEGFKAGDILTVYLQGATKAYKVGKDAKTAISVSGSSPVAGVNHTLAANEIETDGTVRIYRNSGNTFFAGVSVAGASKLTINASSQYATFVTTRAIDMTKANAEGIKAYIVTGKDETTVTTEEVTEVPANTAILLKAASEGGEAVNVSVDDIVTATLPSPNKLKYSDLEVAGDGSTIYGFFKVGGQYGFAPVALGSNLPARKAYLEIDGDELKANFLALDFDGETTAINEVEAAKKNAGEYFNLAGQRVAQPTKGLYIVNGKKVIIK